MEGKQKQKKNKKHIVKKKNIGRRGHSIFVGDSAADATSVPRVTGAQPPSSASKAVHITTERCRKKPHEQNDIANILQVV
jgi:hypothetical protein